MLYLEGGIEMLERAREWMMIAGILALSLQGLLHSAHVIDNQQASASLARVAYDR
jgi:hypothetical protein